MSEISSGYLRRSLDYDKETGSFTWLYRDDMHRRWNARYPGKQAGRLMPNGYASITIKNKLYLAHRIAWLYIHGVWPSGNIDHINGVRNDNRLTNLRDVSSHLNMQNQRKAHRTNKSTGLLGVTLDKRRGTYQAQISINGRQTYIGSFRTPHEAYKAYVEAKRTHHAGCTI